MRLDDAMRLVAANTPDTAVATDLYRYFDLDGDLLYVGVSKSAVVRAMQHQRTASWWDGWAVMVRERYDSRAEALVAELDAISTEQPRFNIAHIVPRMFDE